MDTNTTPLNKDYWVDGHHIAAPTAAAALAEAGRLYDYEPEKFRLWTEADQDQLDADAPTDPYEAPECCQ